MVVSYDFIRTPAGPAKKLMRPQDHQTALFTYPIIVTVLLLQTARGAAQMIVAGIMVVATVFFVRLAAHYIWTPLFKKTGFWTTSLLLGGSIIAGGLAMVAAGATLGRPAGFALKLVSAATAAGLLCSWALAAMRCAQDKPRATGQSRGHPHSVLFRPSPPRTRLRPAR